MNFNNLISIGLLMVFLGFILIFLGAVFARDIKYGVGGFVGFIPFWFSNDPKILKLMMLILIMASLIFFILPMIKYLIK